MSQLLHCNEKLMKNKEGFSNKKVVCKVTKKEGEEIILFCKRNKLNLVTVIDAGRTQVSPGSLTVMGLFSQEEISFFTRYPLY